MRQALRLPNGERIRLDSTPIVRVKPEAPPQSASVLYGPESGRDRVLYRASDIPDSLVHKGWYVDRYDPIALISVEVKPDAREIPPCPGESRAPFEWRSSCGYSDMIPLDDRSALLVYTDFYVPDESGENRKTLLCRKIVVEE